MGSGRLEIKLSNGMVAVCDAEDEQLVLGPWTRAWYAWRHPKGKIWYACQNRKLPDGRTTNVTMHLAILGSPTPGMRHDHMDGDGLNNTRGNLRTISHKGNIVNTSGPRSSNKNSPFLGVSWIESQKRWRAAIMVNGESRYLGNFLTADEANIARLVAEREAFGVHPRRRQALAAAGMGEGMSKWEADE